MPACLIGKHRLYAFVRFLVLLKKRFIAISVWIEVCILPLALTHFHAGFRHYINNLILKCAFLINIVDLECRFYFIVFMEIEMVVAEFRRILKSELLQVPIDVDEAIKRIK